MFDRLQKKWGVTGLRFVLIFCTFAVGGSLTGYLAKLIMPFLGISGPVLYWLIYIIMVTCLWPFCILLASFAFGQFRFFWDYEKKLGRWISGKNRHSR
jgi:phosphoribosylglycinamide formyltransferase 1